MFLVQQITASPLQKQNLVLGDGSQLTLEIYFRPMQYGWFINELVYAPANFILRGLRISNQINMLHQWRNKLPFGLGCLSTANREPTQQQDFSTLKSKLYLLSAAEVVAYTEYLALG